MSDKQIFDIAIFHGGALVGNVQFRIGIHDTTGAINYWAFNEELSKSLKPILDGKRHWKWKNLTTRLSQELTMSTGGRFILRYGVTPSSAGRGEDQLRQQINRTVKETWKCPL